MLETMNLADKSMLQQIAQRYLLISGIELRGNDIARFDCVPHSNIVKIMKECDGLLDMKPWNNHPGMGAIWELGASHDVPSEHLWYDGYLVSADRSDFRITLDALRISTNTREESLKATDFYMDLIRNYGPDEYSITGGAAIDAYLWWD